MTLYHMGIFIFTKKIKSLTHTKMGCIIIPIRDICGGGSDEQIDKDFKK